MTSVPSAAFAPQPPPRRVTSLAFTFLAAVVLHLAAIGAVVWWRNDLRVNPPGEQTVTIDLAPQLVDAPTDQSVETAEPAGAPSPLAPADVDSVVAAQPADSRPVEPDPAPPPVPVQTAQPPVADAAVPPEPVPLTPLPPTDPVKPAEPTPPAEAPPPDAAVPPDAVMSSATPPPPDAVLPPDLQPIGTTAIQAFDLPPPDVQSRPLPHPPPRPVHKPPAAQPRPRLASRPAPAEARSGAGGRSRQEAARGAASRENTGGSAAAADPNALSRYAAELAAALRSRLRYPEGATGGTAVLRFTVQRSGRVLSASIVRTAGDPAIDAAALATARPGSSLPAAPEGVPQPVLTISVPLQFNRR